MTSPTPKLLLVDGHSLAFRSYYAFSKGRDGGLRNSEGVPTSVAFGFIKALLETIETENPDYVAIAFDLGGPTFRHIEDPTYKANRSEAPEDFRPDLDNLILLLRSMRFKIVVSPGYEADDVIGTMATKATIQGWTVRILSGDRDLFQLVDDNEYTKILYMSSTFGKAAPPPREFGIAEVKEKMGVFPSQVVDFKALCGDSSDNITGVKGIGEKTATTLINSYGTLDKVYESIEELKGAVKRKLEEGKDSAYHSQRMAQIALSTPLDHEPEACKLEPFDPEEVQTWIDKLEFKTFSAKIEKLRRRVAGENAETPEELAKKSQRRSPYVDPETWFFSAEDTEKSSLEQSQLKPATISPEIIDTVDKLNALVEGLKLCTNPEIPVAWDTETTSLEPRDAKLVGLGCCWAGEFDGMAYIPIGHLKGQNLPLEIVLNTLRPILESDTYPKALQNAKFDRLVLKFQGINLAGVVFDTMLASYVIQPEAKHNLTDLSLRYLGLTTQSFSSLVPKGKTIADLPIADVAIYCGTDVYTTFLLVGHLQENLNQTPNLLKLFKTVEMPLEPVLADMETVGICIDSDYLNGFSKELEGDLQRIETSAYSAAGGEFNLGSPKQLSELFFEKLGLDIKKSRKIRTGFSTDAATLEKLQGDHPIIDSIIEYRTLSKLKSTYVDALPNLVRSDTCRVHTDYNQAVTATGRLSSSEPNLQNIPIRTAFSRQIRKAFIPRDSWLLVGADYSQIELRILAHLSQEPILLEAYRNNEDVHTLTARLLLDKDDISSEERRLAKIINFGVIYGMGAQKFAQETNMKVPEAKQFIDRFNQRYSKVFEYLQQMKREAIANCYVETICGRRRYFSFNSESVKVLQGTNQKDIDLKSIRLRDQFDAQTLRAAANAPIQGSSADIIKLAMIQLHPKLKSLDATLLLQVHDELIFEVRPDLWEEVRSVIQVTMENAVQLSVPLKVDIHSGKNWMETK